MISVCELGKEFPLEGGGQLRAVDRLSFRVAGGEVYGLLGPNGAGKTTTLRMILGLLRPSAGYAEVAGFRTSQAPDEVKARIGFVSTGAGLYQWLSVREMLLFFADLYGVPVETAHQKLAQLARILELEDVLDRRCTTLSTGQKQRVVLARALIHDPPVMLLDEPTRGLDVIGSQIVFDYIELLRREQRAVIVCTHRLDQAQRLCDRFGLLHRGRLVQEGSLSQLREATGCRTLVDMFLQILRGDGTPTEVVG